jgi:hypothetical protein
MARSSTCTCHRVGTPGLRAGSSRLPALTVHGDPGEVITDRAPVLAKAIEELVAAALHNTGQYENNRVECDTADSRPGSGPCAG